MAARIQIDTRRGQFILVLLAALIDLSDKIPSKQEVIRHIEKRGYLTLPPELAKLSYNSKTERIWHTELAMARRDALDRGYLKPLKVRDAWEISDQGKQSYGKVEQQFRDGKFDLKLFTFLSPVFLERMGVQRQP